MFSLQRSGVDPGLGLPELTRGEQPGDRGVKGTGKLNEQRSSIKPGAGVTCPGHAGASLLRISLRAGTSPLTKRLEKGRASPCRNKAMGEWLLFIPCPVERLSRLDACFQHGLRTGCLQGCPFPGCCSPLQVTLCFLMPCWGQVPCCWGGESMPGACGRGGGTCSDCTISCCLIQQLERADPSLGKATQRKPFSGLGSAGWAGGIRDVIRYPWIRPRFWKRWLLAEDDSGSFPPAASQLPAGRAALLLQPLVQAAPGMGFISMVVMAPAFPCCYHALWAGPVCI